MDKPDALRLADAIDPFVRSYAPDHLTSKVAAAELRRLHAENERLAAEVANRNRRALDGDEAVSALANVHAYYEGLEAQRDALLEALRTLLFYANTLEMRFTDADGEHRAMQQARAAIKSVEGEKNHG